MDDKLVAYLPKGNAGGAALRFDGKKSDERQTFFGRRIPGTLSSTSNWNAGRASQRRGYQCAEFSAGNAGLRPRLHRISFSYRSTRPAGQIRATCRKGGIANSSAYERVVESRTARPVAPIGLQYCRPRGET